MCPALRMPETFPESVNTIVASQLSCTGDSPVSPEVTDGLTFSSHAEKTSAAARRSASALRRRIRRGLAERLFFIRVAGQPRFHQFVEMHHADRAMLRIDHHQLGDRVRLQLLE